jgi:hypothetical protein
VVSAQVRQHLAVRSSARKSQQFHCLFFTPVTTEKHLTKYLIDEFGVALAVTIPLTAFILWRWQRLVDTDAATLPG